MFVLKQNPTTRSHLLLAPMASITGIKRTKPSEALQKVDLSSFLLYIFVTHEKHSSLKTSREKSTETMLWKTRVSTLEKICNEQK
jgi:hypothetical protein